MKTVFDFNITDDEWDAINGDIPKKGYKERVSMNTALADIGTLLWMRKQEDEARKYIEQITDEEYKYDVYRTVEHPI